jgi:hypothetical protein
MCMLRLNAAESLERFFFLHSHAVAHNGMDFLFAQLFTCEVLYV